MHRAYVRAALGNPFVHARIADSGSSAVVSTAMVAGVQLCNMHYNCLCVASIDVVGPGGWKKKLKKEKGKKVYEKAKPVNR